MVASPRGDGGTSPEVEFLGEAIASHTQRLPARHEQFQARIGSEQIEQKWRCLHHLLEVVQYEQQVMFL